MPFSESPNFKKNKTPTTTFEGSVPQSRYNRWCLSPFQKWILNQFLLIWAVLKKYWADYEQLLRTVFFMFSLAKFFWGDQNRLPLQDLNPEFKSKGTLRQVLFYLFCGVYFTYIVVGNCTIFMKKSFTFFFTSFCTLLSSTILMAFK